MRNRSAARPAAGSSRASADYRGVQKIAATVAVALALLAATSDAATGGRPTLFGMDVPSLRALDAAERTVGARPAIVGTFADWAHHRDFPRALAAAINDR